MYYAKEYTTAGDITCQQNLVLMF